jgi:hypothetical protein
MGNVMLVMVVSGKKTSRGREINQSRKGDLYGVVGQRLGEN